MLKNDSGKLTVRASTNFAPNRLQSVKTAAKAMAKHLSFDFEMVPAKGSPIYVYYEEGGEEPIPVYWDDGRGDDAADVASKMRSMMFVLSFHPRHVALRQARKALLNLGKFDALTAQ
jgi:hypothetical protein